MTTVKQILEWPLEYTSGGFTLHVVTAKKKKKVGDKWIQRATVSDGQNEMLASFVLNGNVPMPANTPVQIKFCRRLEFDVGNRVVQGISVPEWELPTKTADEWETENLDIKEEWQKDQDQRIRGMCRYGLVREYRKLKGFGEPIPGLVRDTIKGDVDFIVGGK
jgi:hypothetical protein